MSKLIAIDFDGVIHSYTSKWVGATHIPDPPVPGAFDFIQSLQANGLQVAVFSTRNTQPGGILAMQNWFKLHGMPQHILDQIQFPAEKPVLASLFIDDRGFCFKGQFPTIDFCKSFKPWYK